MQWAGFELTNARAILCLGSDPGHCNVATLHDVVTAAGQISLEQLTLSDTLLYATIRVTQDGKKACSSSSLALRIDDTPPVAGRVSFGLDAGSPLVWTNRYVLYRI